MRVPRATRVGLLAQLADRHPFAVDLRAPQLKPFGALQSGLVPDETEQAALARAKELREGKSLREIAAIWAEKFGLPKLDPKSLKRILDRAA